MTDGRRPSFRSALLGLAVLAVAALATSCSDDEPDTDGPDKVEELALGTAAEIDYFPTSGDAEPISSGTVTVTGVRTGSPEDLTEAGYTLDDDQLASTTYYVDVRFENEGTVPVEPKDPVGVDETGETILSLTLIDLAGTGFEPCDGIPEKVKPGATAEGCAIVLVPEGHTLSQVSYLPHPSLEYTYWKSA